MDGYSDEVWMVKKNWYSKNSPASSGRKNPDKFLAFDLNIFHDIPDAPDRCLIKIFDAPGQKKHTNFRILEIIHCWKKKSGREIVVRQAYESDEIAVKNANMYMQTMVTLGKTSIPKRKKYGKFHRLQLD